MGASVSFAGSACISGNGDKDRITALERKYPKAGLESRNIRRHHTHPSCVQKAIRRAVSKSGINKRAGVHTLRHCFETHMLMAGVDLCVSQPGTQKTPGGVGARGSSLQN